MKPYVTSLKTKGIDLVINRHNIKEHISQKAKIIKQLIISETKNKLVAVMVDIATRYNRSVLGINISYMKDDVVCIRTIGMHVLLFSHTAANIRTVITNTLSDFEIHLKQVVAIICDNGKNLTKSVDLIDAVYQQTKPDEESDEYIDSDVFDDEYYADLLSRVRLMFDENMYTDLIHGITCAAHCLHLVVTHALKETSSANDLIVKCRNLAKKLRTSSIRPMISTAKRRMPMIDMPTRWNSIYSMVR